MFDLLSPLFHGFSSLVRGEISLLSALLIGLFGWFLLPYIKRTLGYGTSSRNVFEKRLAMQKQQQPRFFSNMKITHTSQQTPSPNTSPVTCPAISPQHSLSNQVTLPQSSIPTQQQESSSVVSSSSTSDFSSAFSAWQSLERGGSLKLLSSAEASLKYGIDVSGSSRSISGALQIHPAQGDVLNACLQEVIRIASQYSIAIYPISTGKNWGYGTSLPAKNDSVIIDLSQLQAIDFDAEMGVVTLQPGVTQGMLSEFLISGGHEYLVPVTGAGPTVSIVGNAIDRGYGITPFTDHFSAVTDIEAILPDSSIYHTALREAGGRELSKLFKWGLGPYSVGLFTQSSLGLITSMSIHLAERPECVKVMFFSVPTEEMIGEAVERLRLILTRCKGVVGGINLMNRHRILAMTFPYPHENLGEDGLIPDETINELAEKVKIGAFTGFGTLYGTKRMVEAVQEEIRELLQDVTSSISFLSQSNAKWISRLSDFIPGAIGTNLKTKMVTLQRALELVDGRPNETALPLAYWRKKKDPVSVSTSAPSTSTSSQQQQPQPRDPARDGCGLIWYSPLVPMRHDTVTEYLRMATRIMRKHGIEPLITLTSLSEKLFDSSLPIVYDRSDEQQKISAYACYEELIREGKKLTDSQGNSTPVFPYRLHIDAMKEVGKMHPLSSAFHAKLKSALDPHGIMSPNRYC